MSAASDPARKLAAARARLALERPFIGALVMHLPLVPRTDVRTIGTDALAVYFNPSFVASLSLAETQFVLAHEALHCALGHFHRGRQRLRGRWDRAADYCVNQLLVDDGMAAPAGVLLDPAYRGMAAEEIYAVLGDDAAGGPLDDHWFGPSAAAATGAAGAGANFPGTREEGLEELAVGARATARLYSTWQDRLAAAAGEAGRRGRLSPAFRGAIDRFIQPRLPWRTLLARFLMATARDDYSFHRPSRRDGPAILPGLRSATAELVLALDTSGSVTADELRQFIAETDALKGAIHARVTLLACDAALAPGSPWHFEAWEPIRLPPDLAGGGGTRFTPVYDWIDAQALRPAALLYFTDAQGEFPARPPDYPVLWLVKGNAPVPWGERVQLN